MALQKAASRNPWTFIPTLYFAEGVPYILINAVSVIFYKRMGVDNATLAFWTSLLYLPWVIKMLWGPIVDTNSTKRTWILGTQFAMMTFLGLIAAAIQLPTFFVITLIAFFAAAFVSATHDIAADGFYMIALSKDDQSLFVGIRSTFYRFAMIFGQGIIVWIAGQLELSTGNVAHSWSFGFGLAAALFAVIAVWHRFILPAPPSDHAGLKSTEHHSAYVDVFASYFKQKKIGVIVAFILLYRFGEAFLIKMASPFFLDAKATGGLGLTTSEVGIVYGTIGVGCLLAGGITGGIIIKKFGLRKCLWPMAFIINIPMYVYIVLSQLQPSVYVAAPMVALEQFSYGFGFTAYTVYLMFIARGEYKTSHFAISTGLMALGMMLPGLASGYLQKLMGYQHFFIFTAVLGIPGIITLFFIPLPEDEQKTE
jgi:MFS transporter, PAT family, beta-lactamase induction signal transducer AmpG